MWVSSVSQIRISSTIKHQFCKTEPCQLSRLPPCNATDRSAVVILLDGIHWLEALYQVLKLSTLLAKYSPLLNFFKKTKYFNCKWSWEFFWFLPHDYFKLCICCFCQLSDNIIIAFKWGHPVDCWATPSSCRCIRRLRTVVKTTAFGPKWYSEVSTDNHCHFWIRAAVHCRFTPPILQILQ